MDEVFHLKAPFQPTGDQPQAIEALMQGIHEGDDCLLYTSPSPRDCS